MKLQQFLVPAIVLSTLVALGLYVDHQRSASQNLISGVFESQPTQISTRQPGRVQKILAKEGQTVRKGDLLLELETGPDDLQTESLRSAETQAKAHQTEIRNGPRAEEIARRVAVVAGMEAMLDRAKHGPRPQEIAEAKARLQQATSRFNEAKNGPRREEILAAEATARKAEATYRAALRGATSEERAQLQARLDAAKAQEDFAHREAIRREALAKEGALAVREAESARAQADAASANRRDVEQAVLRALRGTPAEELDQAKQSFESAKFQLDLLRAGTRPEQIQSAKADVVVAQQALSLLESGTRIEDIRAAEASLEEARAVLLELKHGNRKEDIAQSDAAAQIATLNANSASVKLGERKIFAPVDGVVDRVLVAEGDLVSAGTIVIRVNNPADIWIRAYVPESLLAKFIPGDDASLAIDGIKGPVPGVIESIASEGEFTPANLQTPEERGRQVFAVRIRLRAPDPRVKAGLSASVRRLGQWP